MESLPRTIYGCLRYLVVYLAHGSYRWFLCGLLNGGSPSAVASQDLMVFVESSKFGNL